MGQGEEIPSPTIRPKKSRKKLVTVVFVIVIVIFAIAVVGSLASPNSSGQNLYGSSLVKMPGASPEVDEQEIISFDGDFTALSFNLTAVAQQDTQGYGPAYLLNGLSNTGFWYQVGITYHWPSMINNTSYRDSGFSGVYEAFASNGSSIFPTNGGSGTMIVNVNPEDPINLYLAFMTNGTVEFAITDFKTKSSGVEYFSSFGATYFESAGGLDNDQGLFTGLMTEFYHSSAYYGDETAVSYTPYGGNITEVWIGVDEYNASNSSKVSLFYNSSPLIDLSQYSSGYTYTYEGTTVIATHGSFTTG